jgi:hypothetical protein
LPKASRNRFDVRSRTPRRRKPVGLFRPGGSRNALEPCDGVYVIKTTRTEQVTGDGEGFCDAVTFFRTVTASQVFALFLFLAKCRVFLCIPKAEDDMITQEKLESVRGKARVRSAKQRESDSANLLPTTREIDNALRNAVVLFLHEKDIFEPRQIGSENMPARGQGVSQSGPQFEDA